MIKIWKHILLIVIFFILSCGYEVKKTSQFSYKSINLKSVKNITTEPSLEEIFIKVFTEEALIYGIDVTDNNADISLDVIINHCKIVPISVKKDTVVEYAVEIKADIKIITSKGNVYNLNKQTSEFIKSFFADESITAIQIEKERVIEDSLRELSKKVLSEIIFSFLK